MKQHSLAISLDRVRYWEGTINKIVLMLDGEPMELPLLKHIEGHELCDMIIKANKDMVENFNNSITPADVKPMSKRLRAKHRLTITSNEIKL